MPRAASINRQLVDLYVTLLYILDDFLARSGIPTVWLENIKKHVDSEIDKHGNDPVWADYMRDQQAIPVKTAIAYDVTPEQQADLDLIPWWARRTG